MTDNRVLRICVMLAVPGIWLAIMFLLSSDPHSSRTTSQLVGGEFNMLFRKSAHFLEYLLLFVLIKQPTRVLRMVWDSQAVSTMRTPAHLTVFLVVVLLACLDEWHQSFVPHRHSTASDVLIDTLGALMGWCLLSLFNPKQESRRHDRRVSQKAMQTVS